MSRRFAGLASFLLIAAGLAVVLRLVHVGVPVFYPKVLQGPFSLEEIAEVEEYAGFSPLIPFYRPETLGIRPVTITVVRRPRPRSTIFWQADHFLVLQQTIEGRRPAVAARARPLEGSRNTLWWREGRTVHALARRGRSWIELRTDLPAADLPRLIDTLRPAAELR